MEFLDWKGSKYCLTDFFRKGGGEGTPKVHQKTGILLFGKGGDLHPSHTRRDDYFNPDGWPRRSFDETMRLIQWWMAARKEPWEVFLKINNDSHIMSHNLKTQQNLWHILKTPQRSMQLCEVGCIRQVIAEELEKSSCDICICAAFSTPTPNYIYNHDYIFIAAKLHF